MITISNANSNVSKNQICEQQDLYKILYYASLAGSSHNTQPWKVQVISNDSILVFADEARLLKVVDSKGIELVISIGAFIENLSIAANALGFSTEIKILESSINFQKPLVSIKLNKKEDFEHKQNQGLKDLELRTTLRMPFDNIEIRKEDIENLLTINKEKIKFVSANTSQGQFISKLALQAYTIQAYQKDAQDELVEWIRFSNKDVNSKNDGLSTSGMGIYGISSFFVRNFFKPEDSKKASFVKKGVEKAKILVENCGGWLLITSSSDNLEGLINVGRIYERLNIECCKLKLGFHPMNQIIEIPETTIELEKNIVPKGKIRFIARIGYVKEIPAPVSKRRKVENFTVFK